MLVNIITNGLLLTPEIVDRLAPYGLNGIKITLDGDRDTHNQHAAAARRPGHLRQDRQQHAAGRAQEPDCDRRQLRRWRPLRPIRRCSIS